MHPTRIDVQILRDGTTGTARDKLLRGEEFSSSTCGIWHNISAVN